MFRGPVIRKPHRRQTPHRSGTATAASGHSGGTFRDTVRPRDEPSRPVEPAQFRLALSGRTEPKPLACRSVKRYRRGKEMQLTPFPHRQPHRFLQVTEGRITVNVGVLSRANPRLSPRWVSVDAAATRSRSADTNRHAHEFVIDTPRCSPTRSSESGHPMPKGVTALGDPDMAVVPVLPPLRNRRPAGMRKAKRSRGCRGPGREGDAQPPPRVN